MKCFVLILFLESTRRFHPCYYRESPLPGNPDHLWRFKSGGHHTDGFATIDDARPAAVELGAKLHDCPPSRVITDRAVAVDDPVGVMILTPFTDDTFSESLRRVAV